MLLTPATSAFEPPTELDEVEDLFYSQVKLKRLYSKIRGHMDGSSGDAGPRILFYFFQEHIFDVLDQCRVRSTGNLEGSNTRWRKREAFFCQVKDMMSTSNVIDSAESEVVSNAWLTRQVTALSSLILTSGYTHAGWRQRSRRRR